ncbi:unnamed protein product, partial [Prorocentrum cordatum]
AQGQPDLSVESPRRGPLPFGEPPRLPGPMSAADVAPGREFWIVAAGCDKEKMGQEAKAEKMSVLADLKSSGPLTQACRLGGKQGPWQFDVPDGDQSLRHGTFDDLNMLADNLPKYDSQVDSILHRLERQIIELNNAHPEGKAPSHVQFKVKSQRQEKGLLDYLSDWKWDEAKYPKTRLMAETCQSLMHAVNRLDDEARSKTNQYNEYKTQKANIDRKDGALLTGADLIDVLTPSVVKMGPGKSANDDFIYTEHLTTVTVILTKGAEVEFLKTYEKMTDSVVPKSAKRFDHESVKDKDGNTVWRVVMFKDCAEPFKKACRERRYITRDFEYSEDAYNKREAARKDLEDKVKREYTLVMSLYQAAWSDVMVAWIHIKAMRVFAESALWSGLPPKFAAFVVSPVPGKGDAVRKVLADKLGKLGGGTGPGSKGDADDGEEDYPYVSLSFVPFTVPR